MSVEIIDETIQSVFLLSITDTLTLDHSVEEVMGLMLGVPVSVAQDTATPESDSVTLTAVIGLAGALSGAYTVLVPAEAAMQMTTGMAGIEFTTVDETVIDGLGEITNMLAGAWKSKIHSLNSACLLSVPTVVTGTQYEVHKRTSAFRLSRSYRFNDSLFIVSIYGENP